RPPKGLTLKCLLVIARSDKRAPRIDPMRKGRLRAKRSIPVSNREEQKFDGGVFTDPDFTRRD
ncbi:MAG: hypothetical protein ACLFVQ_10990, partial [Chitinispirillaceae bacterium]